MQTQPASRACRGWQVSRVPPISSILSFNSETSSELHEIEHIFPFDTQFPVLYTLKSTCSLLPRKRERYGQIANWNNGMLE